MKREIVNVVTGEVAIDENFEWPERDAAEAKRPADPTPRDLYAEIDALAARIAKLEKIA